MTALGDTLTEAHRLAQVRLRGATVQDMARLWPALDPLRLEATWDAWYAAVADSVALRHAQSAQLAGEYLTAFRAAEIGAEGEVVLASMVPSEQLVVSARVTGPVAIKRLTAAGMDPLAAAQRAFTLHSGATSRIAMAGGRNTVERTVEKDPEAEGYRRVSDGNPCAFCAMLLARGGVYKKATAEFTADGRRYHDHCGCHAKPVYDLDDPGPVASRKFRNLWDQAKAADGDTYRNFRRLIEGRQ